MSDISSITQRLAALIKESGAKIILVAQVANPHTHPRDIGMSWDPLIVNHDYMHILDSLDGLRSHE